MSNFVSRLFGRRALIVVSLLAIVALLAVGVFNVQVKGPGGDNGGLLSVSAGQRTLVIGAVDSVAAAGTVDYTCDGVADNVQFQAALNALPAGGGRISVLAGTYVFAAGTSVTRAIDNVTISGVGRATYFTGDGVTAIFAVGGANWKFEDLRTDAGGITENATTVFTNVLEGATYWGGRVGAGEVEGSNFDINGGTVDSITSLTGVNDLDIGAFELRAQTFESDVATGTAPFTVASTTTSTNLSADLVDGYQMSRGVQWVIAASDATNLEKAQADVLVAGAADDEIQAAITAGYRYIGLTSGSFSIGSSVLYDWDTRITGVAMRETVLTRTVDVPVFAPAAAGALYVTLENLTVSGAGKGVGVTPLITMDAAVPAGYLYVRHVMLQNSGGVGIYMPGGTIGLFVSDSRGYQLTDAFVSKTDAGISTFVTIRDSLVNLGGRIAEITAVSGLNISGSGGDQFDADLTAKQLFLSVVYGVVSGNHFENPTGAGDNGYDVKLEFARGLVFAGNRFDSGGRAGSDTYTPLRIAGDGYGSIITGNYFQSSNSTNEIYVNADVVGWTYSNNYMPQGMNVQAGADFRETALIWSSQTMTFDPGADANMDLVEVDVTDTPTFAWNEGEDYFSFSKRVFSSSGFESGYFQGSGPTSYFQSSNGDDRVTKFQARDNGVGLVDVGSLQGAADPYAQWGQFKFYQSGSAEFGGSVGNVAQATTLGLAATTFAASRDFVTLTGDGGGNTLATITGGVVGQRLTILFVDALVTITDDNTHAANTVDLSAAFTGADDTVLTLLSDGTSWYEISRSAN